MAPEESPSESVNAEAERLRLQAVALRERGQTDAAIDMCNKAIALSPSFSSAYRTRGALYVDKAKKSDSDFRRRFEEANSDFRRCLELDPKDADCWYNLGDSQGEVGDYRSAADSHGRALEINPNDLENREKLAIAKGFISLRMNNPSQALESFSSVLATKPYSLAAHLGRSWAYLDLHDEPKVIGYMNGYFEAMIKDRSLYSFLAKAWTDINAGSHDASKYDSARQTLGDLIEHGMLLPDAWYLMGQTFVEHQHLLKAIEAYGNASRLDPSYALALAAKGSHLFDYTKNFKDTMACYDEALSINDRSTKALGGKAWLLFLGGDYRKAIDHCNQALAVNKRDYWAWLCKGLSFFHRGDRDDRTTARTYIKMAIDIRPDCRGFLTPDDARALGF
jgi:tetratricopeptide (TPR) repeat protein